MSACTSKLKKVGVALGGATYADPSGSFTRGLLASDLSVNPSQTVDPVPEVRGTLNTIRTTKGPIEHKCKVSFPLDAGDNTSASIGDFLASILGAEAGSIVTAKYKHRFTAGDVCDPAWLNLWSDKDATPKQYCGFRAGTLKMTVDAKEGLIPVEVEGLLKNESSLGAQTLAFSGAQLIVPSMASVLTLGGSSIADIESIEFNIARGQEGVNTLGTSRNINRLVSGKNLLLTLALNGLAFSTETERAKFLANTTSSLALKLLDGDGHYLEINAPEITYQTFDGPDVKGEDLLRLSIAALVTGDDWFVDLYNTYSKLYTTGATIV